MTIALRSGYGTGAVNRTVINSIQIGAASATVRIQRPKLLRTRPDAACDEQEPSNLAGLRHMNRACFLLSLIRAITSLRRQR